MAKPIEMLFRLGAQVAPGNHVLDWGPDPPWEGVILRCKWRPVVKYRDTLQLLSAKTAEPIVMPFGLWAQTRQRNHKLDGDPDAPRRRGSFGGKVRSL